MESSQRNTEMKAEIDARLKSLDQLPAMPSLVLKLHQMTQNPDVDMKALAEEISRDPGITATVLRLSNSAYYKPSRSIRSVHEAIVTLGLDTVKSIVLVAASRGILKVDLESYRIEADEMWDHSLLTGEIAGSLAKMRKGLVPHDVAFTAGLLHDIGKVVLVHYFGRVYRQAAQEMEQNPKASFTALERKYCGYSHDELGGRLLKLWKFPDELVEAALLVYHPEMARVNPALCAMVHIANQVVLAGGVGVDVGGLNEKLSSFAIEKLQLKDKELETLYAHLPELLEKMHDLRNA